MWVSCIDTSDIKSPARGSSVGAQSIHPNYSHVSLGFWAVTCCAEDGCAADHNPMTCTGPSSGSGSGANRRSMADANWKVERGARRPPLRCKQDWWRRRRLNWTRQPERKLSNRKLTPQEPADRKQRPLASLRSNKAQAPPWGTSWLPSPRHSG